MNFLTAKNAKSAKAAKSFDVGFDRKHFAFFASFAVSDQNEVIR